MSLYKYYMVCHTCTECGREIEEGEPYWSNSIDTTLCEQCANKEE